MESIKEDCRANVAIIGGGIIGLATAHRLLQRWPNKSVVVLEKEDRLAAHQTGHNSGVLHSGIYYRPGSLKAVNCRAGKRAMEEFAREHGIDFDICGKVIVAVDASEVPALENIYERGQANGVACQRISPEQLAELEPHATGVAALHVPETGIIDFVSVCHRLAELVEQRGGRISLGTEVSEIFVRDKEVVLRCGRKEVRAEYAVNCGGLQCDRLAKMSGDEINVKIVPFRGEYFQLRPRSYHLCRNLIYPVPNPSFPFLGVHFTRMIDGSVECGPNAVLSFAREGYSKFRVHPGDLIESLSYRGFQKVAAKYWKIGAGEMWRSLSKSAFVRALQRLVPDIQADDLVPAPAGVRAQAIARDGTLVDDFLISESDRVINVLNAPSPAATASLNIGNLVVDKVEQRWR